MTTLTQVTDYGYTLDGGNAVMGFHTRKEAFSAGVSEAAEIYFLSDEKHFPEVEVVSEKYYE